MKGIYSISIVLIVVLLLSFIAYYKIKIKDVSEKEEVLLSKLDTYYFSKKFNTFSKENYAILAFQCCMNTTSNLSYCISFAEIEYRKKFNEEIKLNVEDEGAYFLITTNLSNNIYKTSSINSCLGS